VSSWLVGVALTFAAFVAWHHAGPWLPSIGPRAVPGSQLQAVRGTIRVDGKAIILEEPGEDGSVVATAAIDPPIEASDYRYVQVLAIGAFPRELNFVWRTERGDKAVPRLQVLSSGGRILPIPLSSLDGWTGRILGVGLISRGPLSGPLRIEGLEFRPASVWTTIGSIFSDWLEFEPWDGGSIHFMAGGNPSLKHPLPLFLGVSFLVSVVLYLFVMALGHTQFRPQVVLAIALLGWAVIDARWQLNLWKQLDITRFQYAGRSWEDKRRAAEDGRLFEFMREAKTKIGERPAHVFIYADEEFDRVRGAYHLFPKNVHVRPKIAGLYPASVYKPGDVIVLYRKRGVQYHPAEKRLRWEGEQSIPADMVYFFEGSGVFRVLSQG
jgi:hypothetical protein